MAASAEFTTYDMTCLLRALFAPAERNLPHYDRHGAPGVQPEVHRQMAGYLLGGVYDWRTAYPNGVDPARLYTPATRRGGRRGASATAASGGAANGALPTRAWVITGPAK